MDMKKLAKWLHRYRFPVIVLALGLLLLALPSLPKQQQQQTETAPAVQQTPALSQQLERILAQMQGVGRVQVMLAVSAGEQTLYQTDENSTDTTVRKETVIITDSQRNQHALVSQVLPQRYCGAIVVCQGADNPAVKLAIVEAVCRATGLGADSISVLKMK